LRTEDESEPGPVRSGEPQHARRHDAGAHQDGHEHHHRANTEEVAELRPRQPATDAAAGAEAVQTGDPRSVHMNFVGIAVSRLSA
jgi:hypothetical protein